MFKTILIALDGSEGSEAAIPVAAELAKQEKAKLVVAHVDEYVAGKAGSMPARLDEDAVRAGVQKQADELSGQGIEVTVEMSGPVLGGPAHTIADIADSTSADLIVVGTRGHTPVSGLLLGSVTQRLLHIARRPVLAVPPKS